MKDINQIFNDFLEVSKEKWIDYGALKKLSLEAKEYMMIKDLTNMEIICGVCGERLSCSVREGVVRVDHCVRCFDNEESKTKEE